MTQSIFTLPSTAQIEFRKVKLAEESLLSVAAKKKRSNIDAALTEIMTRCAVSVKDPGPYPFMEVGGKPDWNLMAKGDRFAAMLDLRCLTYRDGHLYDVDLRCTNSLCGEKFNWEVDIPKDVLRINFPQESVDKLRSGGLFEVTIDGKVVKYNIAIGKTEEVYNRLCMQYPGRDMASALRARIVEVEGLQPSQIMDWLDGEGGSEFEGLTSQDAEDLRDAFDRVDGGVDTTLEAECPACHSVIEFDLPFSGIFLPGKGISERRRRLRREAMARREESKTTADSE